MSDKKKKEGTEDDTDSEGRLTKHSLIIIMIKWHAQKHSLLIITIKKVVQKH